MVPSVTINHPSLSQCQPDWFSQLQSPLWGSWKYPMLYTRVIRPSNGKSPTSHALMSLMFLFNISVRIAERKVYYHSDWHWLTTYGLYPSIIHIYYIYVYIPTVSIYIPTAWFKPCCFYRCPPRQPRPQRLANAHAHAAAAALWRRRGGGGFRQVVVFTHLDDHALSISWGFHGIMRYPLVMSK